MIELNEKYLAELAIQEKIMATEQHQHRHSKSKSKSKGRRESNSNSHADTVREPSTDSDASQSTILPTWMTKIHVFLISSIVVIAIALIIFWSVWPYVRQKTLKTNTNGTFHPSTGFRTSILICSSIINGFLLLSPFFVWYSKSWKISSYSQKELPLSQRSLYYSYSINEGAGHKIATLGVAISNMLWALIIIFRFEFYKTKDFTDYEQEGSNFNKRSAIACLFLGLLARMFMAAVPSFPVHTHPFGHYASAILMFITIAAYMLVETFAVDASAPDALISYYDAEFIFRRISSLIYCLGVIIVVVFMYLELFAFSSMGELIALIASELYILTYITSFKLLDGHYSYLSF